MLDGALLASFAAFAETLNFTHAAKRVGLSQPAFFERIRKLEEEVGATLYERNGRALTLTAAGTRVLAFARESRAQVDALLAELRSEAPPRTVRLAAGEGAYLYLLGPALTAFARANDAALELATVGGADIVQSLRRGEADLGVAALDLVPPTLVAHPLVRTPLSVALPARHALAKKRAVKVAELAGERVVLAPDGQRHRELVTRALASGGAAPRRTLEADGWPLMLAFVRMGLGVAVVNGICEAPAGVVLRPLPELGSITYRLLARRSARLSPDAEALAVQIRTMCG